MYVFLILSALIKSLRILYKYVNLVSLILIEKLALDKFKKKLTPT